VKGRILAGWAQKSPEPILEYYPHLGSAHDTLHVRWATQ
jgi:hypothetical protein